MGATAENTNDTAVRRIKAKLTVDEQVAHLKAKGVKFVLCSENEAKRWLTDDSYYFKIMSYRGLFEKRVGGKLSGQYANLDFAYLVDLYCIDRKLRYVLLPMTLDIEHYARTKINREVGKRSDEDGYALVRDYLAGLTEDRRKRCRDEVDRLLGDPLCAEIVGKYKSNMPEWVAMELWTFGVFIDFYKFCAQRWDDAAMLQEHYILKRVKDARNAYAHSACILNNLSSNDRGRKTPMEVIGALSDAGVTKAMRKRKMSKVVLQQIAIVVYAYSRFVSNRAFREDAIQELSSLKDRLKKHDAYYAKNDLIRSSFQFLEKAFDIL